MTAERSRRRLPLIFIVHIKEIITDKILTLRVKFLTGLHPVPRVNSCPRGFCCCVKLDSSYQLSKIAEILWVNQQGALEKQLHPGR